MRHWTANDVVSYHARIELVHRMVDMFHHDEQIMEDRCEACTVVMDCEMALMQWGL